MKVLAKIQKFLSGRYKVDELFYFLFIIYMFLLILNLILNSNIVIGVQLFLVLVILYRFFSKNISKRRKENEVYLKIKNKIVKIFRNKKKKKSDYVYRKCHHCHKKLRLPLPYKRGIKHSKCPSCKNKNTFLILKKQKIEIIK